jgi:tetratricopeptide (TPR) repeat protein
VLDGGDESAMDPVLAERADLLRWMRLGDLLVDRGHPAAALVEYNRAIDPEEPASPTLSNRVARAKLALGDARGAIAAIRGSLLDYPEFADSHRTLGRIHLSLDDKAAALQSFRRAADLDPFDPSVQQALIDLERAVGDATAAARHEAALRVLRRGGPDPDRITYLRPRAVEPSR